MINENKQRQGIRDASAVRVSRRSFLSSLGAAGVVVTAGPAGGRGADGIAYGAIDHCRRHRH